MSRRADRPTVVCTGTLPDAGEHARLGRLADVVVAGSDLAGALPAADAAVVIRPTALTGDLIAAAPRLRVVATVSSGTDHVDTAALAGRGIALVAGGGVAPTAVAEWVLWAALSRRRGLDTAARAFADGALDWGTRLTGLNSRQVGSATIGIVGYGHVGRAVHRTLAVLDARFLVHDPGLGEQPLDGAERVTDLHELCARSDVVTLHLPGGPATRGLIGAAELAALGPEGLLVNAARGEVVDPPALLAALDTGALGACALDCFDPEPADPAFVGALARTGRALLTPHLAGVSRESLAALCAVAVDGIAAHLGVDATAGAVR